MSDPSADPRQPDPTGPRVLDSAFLDGGTALDGLAVIVLNWALPSLTPRLLQKGALPEAYTTPHPPHQLAPCVFSPPPAAALRSLVSRLRRRRR